MKRIRGLMYIPLLVALVMLIAACGAQATPTPASQQPVPSSGKQTTQPQTTNPSGSGAQTFTKQAPADLGKVAPLGPNKMEYLPLKRMTELATAKRAPVDLTNGMVVHAIQWGGEVPLIYGNGNSVTTKPNSIFWNEGVRDLKIVREDDVVQQVNSVISGKSAFFRGTMGMANCALEAFEEAGIKMVPIVQLTWSTGGDEIDVDENIKEVKDLAGKKIALQRCGPHIDFLAKVLDDAGLGPKDVQIQYTRELSLPSYFANGIGVSPLEAMQRDDSSIAAAALISPDGVTARGEGKRRLISTLEGQKIIADVWMVREDFLKQYPDRVEKFVRGYLRASDEVVQLYNNRSANSTRYNELLKVSALILRDLESATGDVEGLLADATFVGVPGNIQFFKCQGTIRCLDTIHREAQAAMIAFGLRTREVSLVLPGWDFAALMSGVSAVSASVGTPTPRFDPAKVEQFATQRQATGVTRGSLFNFQINFGVNQETFSVEQYEKELSTAIGWAETYPGAIIIVTGYADVWGYKQDQATYKDHPQRNTILDQKQQSGKNTSLRRANQLREAFKSLAKQRGIFLDDSQITVVGAGYN